MATPFLIFLSDLEALFLPEIQEKGGLEVQM
jgi:hypothetical protein